VLLLNYTSSFLHQSFRYQIYAPSCLFLKQFFQLQDHFDSQIILKINFSWRQTYDL
jgi:hypothetical protein